MLLAVALACAPPPPTYPLPEPEDVVTRPTVPTRTDWCDYPDDAPPRIEAWQPSGVLPAGDIVQLRHSQGEVWAGSWLSGLWSSADLGDTWEVRDTQITHVYGQLAVHDADPRYVAYPADNVWLTSDGGDTWEQLSVLGQGAKFGGLEFVGDTLVAMDERGGIYERPLSGGELTQVGTMPGVSVDPPHTIKQVQRTFWLVEADDALLAYQADFSLWRSADGGVTWQEVLPGRVLGNAVVAEGREVWAVVLEDGDAVVRFSSDAGNTWSELFRAEGAMGVNAIWPRPDGGVLLVDDSFVYLWDGERVEIVLPEGTLNLLSVLVEPGGRAFIGHSLGIHVSDDGGRTWREEDEGLVDPDAAVIYSIPECPGNLLVGTRCRSGLFRSSDWGRTFERVDAYFHYVMVIRTHPDNMGQMWVTSDDAVLYSSDFGGSWYTSRVKVGAANDGVHVHGLAVDPSQPCSALAGSVGSGIWADEKPSVYRTDDCGFTWVDVGAGLPDGEHSVHAIEFLPEDPRVVLAGTFRGGDIAHDGDPGVGMFRSTDGGASWSKVDLPALDVAMFALCDGAVYAASDLGVVKSTDQGLTWTVAWEPLGDEPVAVTCEGQTVLVMDALAGVWRSDDAGVTWAEHTDGLPQNGSPEYTVGLEIDATGRHVWGTPGVQGLYDRSL